MAGEFKLRRGLKNVFAAEVTNDDNGTIGYTTGTPFHLIPAGEMSRTVNTDKVDVYFDDTVFETTGTEGATIVQITGASLRAANIARILGKDVDSTTGAVLDAGEFVEKYYALGAECEGTDGTSEYFWLMKGTFSAPEASDKSDDETTDTNGMTLEFNAIKTTHIFTKNNKVAKKVVIDTKTSQLKTSQNWFAQVVTPDNIGTYVEKIIPTTGITVSPTTATIAVGGTQQITPTLTPSGATGTVTYSTSDASKATVSSTGLVTGVASGSAVITAVCDGLSDSATITVSE